MMIFAKDRGPLLAALLYASSPVLALAEASSFCASPEALLNAAESCAGNGAFIRAARSCLAKLDAEENARGTQIEQAARGATQGQRKDTSAAREGYLRTLEALSQLQAMAEQGKAELAMYEPYLALPSIELAPLLARNGSLDAAAALKAGCYADSVREVRASANGFQTKIAMYGARRQEALAAATALGTNVSKFQAATSVATPAKGTGSAQPVPAGKSGRSRSQITGKIQDSKLP